MNMTTPAALAAAQDAQRLADDHGPALEMNAQIDADRLGEDHASAIDEDAQRTEDKSGMHPGDAADMRACDEMMRRTNLARCTATANAMLTSGRSLVDPTIEALGDTDETDPSDEEIIELVAETFGMTMAQAIARVRVIDFDALAAEVVPA
jgi:hypothetical protein